MDQGYKYIWDQKNLFEWIKGAKAYLKKRRFISINKVPTWVDQGCKATFVTKRVHSTFKTYDWSG